MIDLKPGDEVLVRATVRATDDALAIGDHIQVEFSFQEWFPVLPISMLTTPAEIVPEAFRAGVEAAVRVTVELRKSLGEVVAVNTRDEGYSAAIADTCDALERAIRAIAPPASGEPGC